LQKDYFYYLLGCELSTGKAGPFQQALARDLMWPKNLSALILCTKIVFLVFNDGGKINMEIILPCSIAKSLNLRK